MGHNEVTHWWQWKNGDVWQHDTEQPAVVVSPLSARMVVWWLICTIGLSTNHFYWLRFFRHCVRPRNLVFWRKSAHMSINHKSRKEERKKFSWIHFHEINSVKSPKENAMTRSKVIKRQSNTQNKGTDWHFGKFTFLLRVKWEYWNLICQFNMMQQPVVG